MEEIRTEEQLRAAGYRMIGSAYRRGYRAKSDGDRAEPYIGLYGIGYVVHRTTEYKVTKRYHVVHYWVRPDEQTDVATVRGVYDTGEVIEWMPPMADGGRWKPLGVRRRFAANAKAESTAGDLYVIRPDGSERKIAHVTKWGWIA